MGFFSSIGSAISSVADEVGDSIGDVIDDVADVAGSVVEQVDNVYDDVAATVEAVADGDPGAIISVVQLGATIAGGALGGPVGASLGNAAGSLLGAAVGEGSFEDVLTSGLQTAGAAFGGPIGAAVGDTLGGFVTGETDLSDFGLDDLAGVAIPAVTQMWGDEIGEALTEFGGDTLQDVLGAGGSLLEGVSTVEELVGVDLSSITGPLDDIMDTAGSLGLGSGNADWGEGWSEQADALLTDAFGDSADDVRDLLDKFSDGDGDLEDRVMDALGDVAGDQLSDLGDALPDEVTDLLGMDGDADGATAAGQIADAMDDDAADGTDGIDDLLGTGEDGDVDTIDFDSLGDADVPHNTGIMPPTITDLDGGDAMNGAASPDDGFDDVAMDDFEQPISTPVAEPDFAEPVAVFEPEPEPTAVTEAVEVADTVEADTDAFFDDL